MPDNAESVRLTQEEITLILMAFGAASDESFFAEDERSAVAALCHKLRLIDREP